MCVQIITVFRSFPNFFFHIQTNPLSSVRSSAVSSYRHRHGIFALAVQPKPSNSDNKQTKMLISEITANVNSRSDNKSTLFDLVFFLFFLVVLVIQSVFFSFDGFFAFLFGFLCFWWSSACQALPPLQRTMCLLKKLKA